MGNDTQIIFFLGHALSSFRRYTKTNPNPKPQLRRSVDYNAHEYKPIDWLATIATAWTLQTDFSLYKLQQKSGQFGFVPGSIQVSFDTSLIATNV